MRHRSTNPTFLSLMFRVVTMVVFALTAGCVSATSWNDLYKKYPPRVTANDPLGTDLYASMSLQGAPAEKELENSLGYGSKYWAPENEISLERVGDVEVGYTESGDLHVTIKQFSEDPGIYVCLVGKTDAGEVGPFANVRSFQYLYEDGCRDVNGRASLHTHEYYSETADEQWAASRGREDDRFVGAVTTIRADSLTARPAEHSELRVLVVEYPSDFDWEHYDSKRLIFRWAVVPFPLRNRVVPEPPQWK